MESANSIRSLYRHFLSGITSKSLNAFYYVCSYVKADYSRFMGVTARAALKLVSERLETQPVFLCIDDTMVPKFGKKFEDVSKLFDHVVHNGSNYLNGYCFVSVMLCVPVWNKDKSHYLSIPLGYCMWQKQESKLELAASMVRKAMPQLWQKRNVIILCEIWYVKKGLLSKEKIGDYYTSARWVLTNIFGIREVLVYVTSSRSGSPRRLFFSTVFPEELEVFCVWQEKTPLNQTGSSLMEYIPLFLCSFR